MCLVIATRVGTATNWGLMSDETILELFSHRGTLYGVGLGILYTVNTSTGVATRVTMLSGINVTAFTSNGSTVYCRRSDLIAISTLDTSNGNLTRVGSADRFGVGLEAPRGLAWHGGKLYLSNLDHPYIGAPGGIYEVNATTGVASMVSARSGSAGPIESHAGVLYMSLGRANERPGLGAIYTVNIETGVVTQVGSVLNYGLSVNAGVVSMSSHNGTLYVPIFGSLYTLETPPPPNTCLLYTSPSPRDS